MKQTQNTMQLCTKKVYKTEIYEICHCSFKIDITTNNMYLKCSYIFLTITLLALRSQAFYDRSGLELARYVHNFLDEINPPHDLIIMSCWKRGII